MESINTLVRDLAVILLLASFLDMLLPGKSMRGFVKLVMGLFVISAILQPLTSFLNLSLSMDIPAWTQTTSEDLPVLAAENQGTKIGTNVVQEQFAQIIENQVKALVITVDGIENPDIKVEFENNIGSFTQQPQIKQIKISWSLSKNTIKPIEPVIIGGSPNPSQKIESSRVQEVRERVSTMLDLPSEKIIIEEN